jgi:hypothetical protein
MAWSAAAGAGRFGCSVGRLRGRAWQLGLWRRFLARRSCAGRLRPGGAGARRAGSARRWPGGEGDAGRQSDWRDDEQRWRLVFLWARENSWGKRRLCAGGPHVRVKRRLRALAKDRTTVPFFCFDFIFISSFFSIQMCACELCVFLFSFLILIEYIYNIQLLKINSNLIFKKYIILKNKLF